MLRAKTASTTSTQATRLATTRRTRTTARTTQRTTTTPPIRTQARTTTKYKPSIIKFTRSTTEKTSTTSWEPSLFQTIRPRLTLPADWGRKTETTTENLDFVIVTTMTPETEVTTKSTTKKMKKVKSKVLSNALIMQPLVFLFLVLF